MVTLVELVAAHDKLRLGVVLKGRVRREGEDVEAANELGGLLVGLEGERRVLGGAIAVAEEVEEEREERKKKKADPSSYMMPSLNQESESLWERARSWR